MPIESELTIPSGHLFLVGALRSGTTMLRLMIDNHPSITFPGEFEYVTPMISDEGNFPELEDYYNYLKSDRGFLMDQLIINSNLDFPDLCNSFLTQRQHNRQTPIIGSTVHHHFNRLPFVWPEARYIKLIRDGRDVARSFISMGWAGNVWKGVEHWIEVEIQWHSFKSTLPKNFWIEVKYEELLENPEMQLTRLCNYIGVPFREEMLDYHKHTTYSPPDFSLAYQWKKKQSEKEIGLLESRIGNMLKELGYELSGLPPIKLSPLMIYKLLLQNKIYCWHFKVKRYGLILSTFEIIARRSKLKRWHKQLKLRMDQIIMKELK